LAGDHFDGGPQSKFEWIFTECPDDMLGQDKVLVIVAFVGELCGLLFVTLIGHDGSSSSILCSV